MAMEDYGLDMKEVLRVIDNADVLIVRFAILDKRLLVDARTTAEEGPFIGLVAKAGSVEERFRSLKGLRPLFPLPEKIMSFLWPRQVGTFRESGLWDRITKRVVDLGGEEIATRCERIFEEIEKREKAEVLMAIRGHESYKSLWERPA